MWHNITSDAHTSKQFATATYVIYMCTKAHRCFVTKASEGGAAALWFLATFFKALQPQLQFLLQVAVD